MKASLLLVVSFFSLPLLAAGKLNYLNVDGDTVYFSTDELKTHSLPACVNSENDALYSLSLSSHSGRAIYALLMTAMASTQAISVTSAQACNHVEGVESARRVEVIPDMPEQTASNSGLFVYKGDGTTKVGPVVNVPGTDSIIFWWAEAKKMLSMNLSRPFYGIAPQTIFFAEPNCSGEAYGNNSSTYAAVYNPFFNNGRAYELYEPGNKQTSSYLNTEGTCIANVRSKNVSKLNPTTTEVCGEYPCILK